MSGAFQLVDILLFIGVAAGLVWFAYHTIFRKIYRARHIRELEMRRLIREASDREQKR